MSKSKIYGTEENRIQLIPKTSKRLFSSKCLKLNGSGKEASASGYVDFFKVTSNKVFHWDTAYIPIMNIISNPYLSSEAIRVGIWLFIHALEEGDEILVDLTGNRIRNWKSIGDEGLICFSSSNKVRANYADTSEAWPLVTRLKKEQICASKEQLIDALFELHHFQYMTVTDVSYENSRLGRLENASTFSDEYFPETPDELIRPHSKFAFIQFNMRLTTHNYSGKWSPMSK